MEELNPLVAVSIFMEDYQVRDYHKWWDECYYEPHLHKRNIVYRGIKYIGCQPLTIGKWYIVVMYDMSEVYDKKMEENDKAIDELTQRWKDTFMKKEDDMKPFREAGEKFRKENEERKKPNDD